MKKKSKNKREIKIMPTDPKQPSYIVQGKGRNSVSQKVFGVRAFQAIKSGLAKSITDAAMAAQEQK